MSSGTPTTDARGPGSLLLHAWQGGVVSRLTLIAGLIISAALTALIVAGTVRFVVQTLQEPSLPWGYKAAAVIFVPLFVLILLVSVPVAWLMHVLNWLSRRGRRSASQR